MLDQAPTFRQLPARHALALCLALLPPICADTTAAEPVYRWVDADGRIQFGDRPPPEGAEPVIIRAAPGADAELESRRRRGALLGEILGEDRAARDAERRGDRQARLDRRAQCAQAQQRLARMTHAGFLYEDSGDPLNPRILDDAERAGIERNLRDLVQRHCGTGTPDP